jgi:excisionase family DNA binding protein
MREARARAHATLTTGEAARICDVASRTVNKWCDSGQLPHFRLPGGQDRRIYRDVLARFMRERGMRVPACLARPEAVLCLGLGPGEVAAIRAAGTDARECGTPFEAGQLLAADGSLWLVAATHALAGAATASAMAALGRALVLVLPEDVAEPPCAGWLRVVRQPLAPDALALAVREAMAEALAPPAPVPLPPGPAGPGRPCAGCRVMFQPRRRNQRRCWPQCGVVPRPRTRKPLADRACIRCAAVFQPSGGRQRQCHPDGCLARRAAEAAEAPPPAPEPALPPPPPPCPEEDGRIRRQAAAAILRAGESMGLAALAMACAAAPERVADALSRDWRHFVERKGRLWDLTAAGRANHGQQQEGTGDAA